MVQKGLKVGHTFKDGGCTYKVLSVNPDGSYVSTMWEDTSEEETNEVTEEPQVKNTTKRGRKAQ